MKKNTNNFDKLSIDINDLFSKKKEVRIYKNKSMLRRLFTRYTSAILIKLELYETLVEIGLIKRWFNDFQKYWYEVLNGRPLFA